MPKPPLIENPGKREIAIAVVMAVVLIGSLGLVALLTEAPMFLENSTADDPAAVEGPR